MRVFKNKAFDKWAAKEGLNDDALLVAINEMGQGLVDADLGGQVFKKRVAIAGRGKSGGVRTLLAYKAADRAFFVYGFTKSEKANVSSKELKALKLYAHVLLKYSRQDVSKAVKSGALIEVKNNG